MRTEDLNYHVSTDTNFRARLDYTKTGDVIHKNWPGMNSTGWIRRILFITGINPEAVLMVRDHYDHPLCPGLQPGPPSQTPAGLGQRYWSVSVVTWPQKPGVSAVGVFRALQPNVRLSRMDPLSGSMDCRQGVCGVVRFDSADGSELQRYAARRPYFEDTFIKSWESCEQKNYR